jgi:hypothetical protein
MSFATQAHLERFLQIDVTNEPDAAVTMLLENATGLIKAYVQRDIELLTYTAELYDPPPTPVLWLKQWPLNTVTTVEEDGTALTGNDDYKVYADEGKIVRVSASGRPRAWRPSNKLQSISVTYDAGYDMTTDPLIEPEAVTARDVCTRMVARVFQAAAAYANAPVGSSGIKTLTLAGSDSVTYSDAVSGVGGVTEAAPQLTDSDKVMLEPLMRKVLISG